MCPLKVPNLGFCYLCLDISYGYSYMVHSLVCNRWWCDGCKSSSRGGNTEYLNVLLFLLRYCVLVHVASPLTNHVQLSVYFRYAPSRWFISVLRVFQKLLPRTLSLLLWKGYNLNLLLFCNISWTLIILQFYGGILIFFVWCNDIFQSTIWPTCFSG